MIENSGTQLAEKHVKEILRRTRPTFLEEENIRNVLCGQRSEASTVGLCRFEGSAEGLC